MRSSILIAIFIGFLGVIYINNYKLNSDILAGLGLDLNKEQKAVLSSLQDNSINILLTNPKDREKIANIAFENGIELNSVATDTDIWHYSLAFMSDDLVSLLNSDPYIFLKDRIIENALFGGFGGDFFRLIDYSKINNGFELENGLLKTKNYYLFNANLKGKDSAIIGFANALNDSGFIASSAAFYNAFAKHQANSESAILGAISLIICAIFIYMIWRSFLVLGVGAVVIFSLFGALAGSLLILDELNFLTLILSTSLIGLIIDYPMHILSAQKNSVFKTLLIAFIISSAGYALFLASKMAFLKEIAVFSLFGLSFGLFASCFWFNDLVNKYQMISPVKLPQMSRKSFLVFTAVIIILAIWGVFRFDLRDENISDYNSSPAWLIDNSKIIASELNTKSGFYLVRNATDFVKENGLKDAFFWSKNLQSPSDQMAIKDSFKQILNSDYLDEVATEFGIDPIFIKQKINEIINQQILSPKELCEAVLNSGCARFYAGDLEVIYSDEKVQNAQFLELKSAISNQFEAIKIEAVILKIIAIILAAIFLFIYFGLKGAIKGIFIVLISIILAALIIAKATIFTIFGLIIASAVVVEYGVFALSTHLNKKQKSLGIITAAFTTAISFGALMFSAAPAVAQFGLAVAVAIIIGAVLGVKFAN